MTNHWTDQIVTPPAFEPVTPADLKAHARITLGQEDSLIAGHLMAARVMIEQRIDRALMPQTWRYTRMSWPGRDYVNGVRSFSNLNEYYKWNHFKIPKSPLQSIVSFVYTDTDGVTYPMQPGYSSSTGNYILDLDSEPARIVLPYSGLWPPTVLAPMQPIVLVRICGYKSFSGVASIDDNGVMSSVSGDQFDPGLAGTWVTVGGVSFDVGTVTDATHMQLVSAATPTGTNFNWTGNLVPMNIRLAICVVAAHWYNNREAVVVGRSVTSKQVELTMDDLLASSQVYAEYD